MLNSENKYHITISFKQKIEGMLLTLVDGTLETVYSAISDHLYLELPQGIYKLTARFIDYIQEYPLIINRSENFTLQYDYLSVAPILDFETTHEYYHGNSHDFSKYTTDMNRNYKPNFLFFAAKYFKDEFPNIIMGELNGHYSIMNRENEVLYQFGSENTKFDNEYGWLAFSNKLENGQYFLKWTFKSESRIFPFYIYDNYQTQFFIRYAAAPDFENCFFFYTKKMAFSIFDEEYLVLEKIRFAFKDYKNYNLLTGKDRDIIQQHPFLVTLVTILQNELGEKLDFENYEHLPLPDLGVISNNQNDIDNSESLPILSSIMNKYNNIKKNNKLSIIADSLVDRVIDNLRYDLFWNNFSKIDNANDWTELYSNFKNQNKTPTIVTSELKINRVLTNTFSKEKNDLIAEKLNSLRENKKVKNYELKISEAINSIKEVSDIAEKLDLPPTMVLRNFDKYKRIYDKIK